MDLASLDTVILAGGLGTRLASVLPNQPKALATIAGRSFLDLLLERLSAEGLRRIVLALGHRADQIVAHLSHRSSTALRIVPIVEPKPLGTAGALRNTLSALHSDPVLVVNGDSLLDVSFKDFCLWHEKRRAPISLLLVKQENTARFGLVDIDRDQHILSFREKADNAGPGLINAGIYLISRAAIGSLPPNQPLSLELDVFPAWIGRGLGGFATSGRFIDIGTPETLADADRFFNPLP